MKIQQIDDILEKKTEPKIDLRLWRGPLPKNCINSLMSVLRDMYKESNAEDHLSQDGFIRQTWNHIHECCLGRGEFWIAIDQHQILGYLIGTYTNEIEGDPTYVIRQAWVDKSIRRSPKVKEMLKTILNHAKTNFARHVLIVSTRSPKAYLRWLGHGWKQYTTILKGAL